MAVSHPRWLTGLLFLPIVVGLAWRSVRYLLAFPIWGDEAFICLNLLERDYLGLCCGLAHAQVAPLLFLWSEETALNWLGASEWSLRLFPLLAGLAAVGLFWFVCRRVLPPLTALLACGLLAVSYYPVRHACEVKPYSFDLLMALVLLAPAVAWLANPGQLRWLALLALAVPITLAGSYPAVFVAGAISVVLVPTMRAAGWSGRGLFVLYNVLMLATFCAVYLLVGRPQMAAQQGTAYTFLHDYWHDWFPPEHIGHWPGWLLQAHTGNMLAYPLGGRGGTSALTALLCLAGVISLWRGRQRSLVVLCLAPFGLSLVAALMHRYPYGGSARLAQHLAPAICLLAAVGIQACLASLPSFVWRRRALVTVGLLLTGVGVVGIGRDLWHPYKTKSDFLARQVVEDVQAQAGDDHAIVVFNEPDPVPVNLRWYLYCTGRPIQWHGQAVVDPGKREVLGLYIVPSPPPAEPLAEVLTAWSAWSVAESRTLVIPPDRNGGPAYYCVRFRCLRTSTE